MPDLSLYRVAGFGDLGVNPSCVCLASEAPIPWQNALDFKSTTFCQGMGGGAEGVTLLVSLVFQALAEAVAIAVHFQEVAVVGQPVYQSGGYGSVLEDGIDLSVVLGRV